MTEKQQQYRKSLIQKIQISKRNVFEDDEQRHEFMLSRFYCKSLKDMTIDQLKLLLDFCNKKLSDIPLYFLSEAQHHKIIELWKVKARDTETKALNSFVKKITGKEQVSALNKDEATIFLVALTKMT